jgi:hypothetical protein
MSLKKGLSPKRQRPLERERSRMRRERETEEESSQRRKDDAERKAFNRKSEHRTERKIHR